MGKILTITVPSYNVEKFLEQTLRSFLDDRIMEDLEVLIVDDGSSDNTAQIGRRYEAEYSGTFRVISKENGGHGSTINCGIREATGKYFKIVDGDDWVQTEGLVDLIEKLKVCETDYVFTNYYEVNDITKELKEVRFPDIGKEKELPFEAIEKETRISMHALVIKTSVLQNNPIRIDEHSFYVDIEYILYPVPYVETVIYFDVFVYMYRLAQVNQSVSMKGYQRHIQNHMDVILHTLDYINDYKKSEFVRDSKVQYMEKRIAEMIHSQVDIFVSFPPGDRKIRERFAAFDREVKEKSISVYRRSGQYSGMLRMLRKTDFHFYRFILWLSRQRNRREKKA